MKQTQKSRKHRVPIDQEMTAEPSNSHKNHLILTSRQIQVLRLIQKFRLKNGYSPTMAELAGILQLNKVTVFEHVDTLVKKGVLHRLPRKSRSLTVNPAVDLGQVGPADTVRHRTKQQKSDEKENRPGIYPMAGYIAAGVPLEAVQMPDSLDLTSMFEAGPDTFALRVRGDSMINEHICDGDYVMIQKCRQARDGEIVVAILENGDATLKKFYREKNGVRLEGANPDFEPIHLSNVNLQGRVIGILRRL